MIGAATVWVSNSSDAKADLSVNAKMPFYCLIYVHGLIYTQEL